MAKFMINPLEPCMRLWRPISKEKFGHFQSDRPTAALSRAPGGPAERAAPQGSGNGRHTARPSFGIK
eukprot:4657845-Pleurochrysis_carterae.AAC.1